jgi:hypothetical protein
MKPRSLKPRSFAILAALFVMALSVAVAAPKNKKTINLSEPTLIGSITVQPGEYTVEWNGTGPDVQVSFSRGKSTLVTVPATLEAAQNRNEVACTYHIEESGSRSLVAIETNRSTLHFNTTDIAVGN